MTFLLITVNYAHRYCLDFITPAPPHLRSEIYLEAVYANFICISSRARTTVRFLTVWRFLLSLHETIPHATKDIAKRRVQYERLVAYYYAGSSYILYCDLFEERVSV